MGTPGEPEQHTASRRGSRPANPHRLRRAGAPRRSFTATLKTLDVLAAAGARVSLRVDDLDTGAAVLRGDDFVTLPVGGVGVVPLLVEVAARIDAHTLDPLLIVERSAVAAVETGGLWHRLNAPALPVSDLAVLAATAGDAIAVNALIEQVGLPAVRSRIGRLGLEPLALLDRFRDRRGPDDAPDVALGSAQALTRLFAALVNGKAVNAAVSAQVAEWLSFDQDLSLVGASTGLDPFAHADDAHGLLFINKTGRAAGVCAEAGVLGGPRAGLAYALIVGFDDATIAHRLRAHDAFRTLGLDLMEYVF